jgi:hypothetical protein
MSGERTFINFEEVKENEKKVTWMVGRMAKYIVRKNLEFDCIVQPHVVTLDVNKYKERDSFWLASQLGKIFNVPHAIVYKADISLTHDLSEMAQCSLSGKLGSHALVIDGGFDTANTIIGTVCYLGEKNVGVTDALAMSSVSEGKELNLIKNTTRREYGFTLHNVMSARELSARLNGIL